MGRDLRPGVEKPLWGLSSYGPAKLEPNLISGLDMSFEELRLNAVMALQSNTVAEYVRPIPFVFFFFPWDDSLSTKTEFR